MLRCVTLIMCLAFCTACDIPSFNLSVVNQCNGTEGNWHAQVRLDNEGGKPWDIRYNYTLTGNRVSQCIDIVPDSDSAVAESTHEHEANCTTKLRLLGYERLDGFNYYKIHTARKTWHGSKSKCESEGAHLVVLNSVEEAVAVGRMIKSVFEEGNIWIGFHDQYKNGEYVTIYNYSLHSTGFTKWALGQPKDKEEYACGWFKYYSIMNFGLGDYECTHYTSFICEHDVCPENGEVFGHGLYF